MSHCHYRLSDLPRHLSLVIQWGDDDQEIWLHTQHCPDVGEEIHLEYDHPTLAGSRMLVDMKVESRRWQFLSHDDGHLGTHERVYLQCELIAERVRP